VQDDLNGKMPALEVDQGELDTERVWTTLPKSLVARLDDFHHANRLRNRSVAVVELIQIGLEIDRRKRSNA
jgi:metal-responsive CopG/Arc/MetJ family transcriptional regulator